MLMSSDSCHINVLFLPHVHVVWIENAIPSIWSLISEHYVAEEKGVLKRVPPAESCTAWIVVGIQGLRFLHTKSVKQLLVFTQHTSEC
jgi:hypothetical protein